MQQDLLAWDVKADNSFTLKFADPCTGTIVRVGPNGIPLAKVMVSVCLVLVYCQFLVKLFLFFFFFSFALQLGFHSFSL
jgi:hypothetical protein